MGKVEYWELEAEKEKKEDSKGKEGEDVIGSDSGLTQTLCKRIQGESTGDSAPCISITYPLLSSHGLGTWYAGDKLHPPIPTPQTNNNHIAPVSL